MDSPGVWGKDRAGAIGRGRIAHLCAHIDVPGVAEDAEVRLFLVEVVVHGSECVSHTGRREREDLSEVSVSGDHRVLNRITNCNWTSYDGNTKCVDPYDKRDWC